MASHDIHLALAPDDEHEEGTNRPDVYEVVLGGWGNSASAIRKGNQGRDLVHVEVGTNLKCNFGLVLDPGHSEPQ